MSMMEKMIGKMMDKFFADMTAEDKQKMLAEMMPRMTEGMMTGGGGSCCGVCPMSNTTEGSDGMEMSIMPGIMTEMMPHCLTMMLPGLPKEKRIDLVLKMVSHTLNS